VPQVCKFDHIWHLLCRDWVVNLLVHIRYVKLML